MTSHRDLTPDDLFALVDLRDPQCAPVGDRWCVVARRADLDTDSFSSQLWAGRLGEMPSMLVAGPVGHARWNPTGAALSVEVERNGMQTLAVVDLMGRETLVEGIDAYVTLHAWSPDGDRIAFIGVTPRQRPVGPRVMTAGSLRIDGVGWLEDFDSHVYVIDVATGRVDQLTDGPFHDDHVVWSPDGSSLLFVSNRVASDPPLGIFEQGLFSVASSGGDARRITPGGWLAALPAFSPDGSVVVFEGYEPGSSVFGDTMRLFEVSATSGSPPPRPSSGVVGTSRRLSRDRGQRVQVHARRNGHCLPRRASWPLSTSSSRSFKRRCRAVDRRRWSGSQLRRDVRRRDDADGLGMDR